MSRVRRHSPLAHAAYRDLVSSLLDEAAGDFRGTPSRVERNGRGYWYDTYRVGGSVRKRYVGEDTPELRGRIERHRALAEERDSRRRERARLVRILRGEGFMSVDAGTGGLIAAMAKSGVFRLGGTIAGTHAFRLYEGELGVRYGVDAAAQTDDLDIASFERLSLALEDVTAPPLLQVLRDFAFVPLPALEPDRVWRWRQSSGTQLVEFLTPAFGAQEGRRPLAALGVDAQALHYLGYLIAEPIPAAVLYRSGVLVQVPRPERFAVHKLIVADRRRGGPDALKSHKDVLQARFVIQALAEDRPDDLADAYRAALARGPRWRERLGRTLERMPDLRALLEALP